MTARDLTPAAATHAAPYGASEARAEIEAFLGEGWECNAFPQVDGTYTVGAVAHGRVVCMFASGPTYRAAVDALLQVWRDAVRPWEIAATCRAVENFSAPRALKEDDK